MKKPLRLLLSALAATLPTPGALADGYQWDVNGTTPGLGGGGTWNTTNAFWDLLGTGLDDGTDATVAYTFTGSDTATFGGTAGIVLVGGTYAGSIGVTTGGYTFEMNGDNTDATFSGMVTAAASGTTKFVNANNPNGFWDYKFNGGLTIPTGGTAEVRAGANAGNANSYIASLSGGGDLTLYSNNNTLGHRIAGDNTGFTGNITIFTGLTRVETNTALGNGGSVTLTGGTLNINGKTIDKSVVLNGGALAGNGGTLSGVVSETGGPRPLTVASSLTLTNTNTYTGDTTVTGGTLSLGNGTTNTGLADTASVSLSASAVLNLNFTGTDSVDKLIINGVTQATGTWGSSASGATNVDDTHFSGTGTLTVLTTIDPFLQVAGTLNLTNNGAPANYSITVNNIGVSQTLDITSITVGGTDATTVSGLTPSLSIPAVGSDTIDFTFTPDFGPGPYDFTLTLASNMPGNPSQVINVAIDVEDPVVSVSTQVLDFGMLANNPGTIDLPVTLTNDGGALDLTIADTTAITGSGAFTILSPALPVVIAPGASTDLTVRFNPGTGAGRFTGTLTIQSNDSNGTIPKVQLRAFVDPAGTVVARYDFDPSQVAGTIVDLDGSGAPDWTTGDLTDAATGTGAISASNQSTANRVLRTGVSGSYLDFSCARESDAQTPLAPGGSDESTWTTFTVTPDAGGGSIDFTGGTAVIDTYANTDQGSNTAADWTLYYSTDGGSTWTSLGTQAGQSTAVNGTFGPLGLSWDLSPVGNRTSAVDFILDPVSTGNTNGTVTQRGVGFDNLVISAGSVTPGTASFASWASGFGIPNNPDYDGADNDGIPALVEYALGLSPLAAEGSPGTLTGSLLSFTKGAEAVANGDVAYAIETSQNLTSWDPATPDTNNATTISYTLPSGQGKWFARLVVTQVTP